MRKICCHAWSAQGSGRSWGFMSSLEKGFKGTRKAFGKGWLLVFIQLTHTGQVLWRALGQLKWEINGFVGIRDSDFQWARNSFRGLCHMGQNPILIEGRLMTSPAELWKERFYVSHFFNYQVVGPSGSLRLVAAGVALVALRNMQQAFSGMFAKPPVFFWPWGGIPCADCSLVIYFCVH